MPKSMEMALPVPTKTFIPRSPDMAMLFAPSGCTHPPLVVAEPISQGHCRKSHDEAESIMTTFGAMGPKGLMREFVPEFFFTRLLFHFLLRTAYPPLLAPCTHSLVQKKDAELEDPAAVYFALSTVHRKPCCSNCKQIDGGTPVFASSAC